MSMLYRIFRSKMERLVPQNDIDKLMVLAREGSKQERIQAYLQLANVVVDLLPEPSAFRESYRNRIIECATDGILDSDVEIQCVAELAAAQQLVQIVPSNSTIATELKNLLNLLRDRIDSFLYNRPTNLSKEQADRVGSIVAEIKLNI